MNPKITWSNFRTRRRLNLADLCESNNITSYKELVSHLNGLWVEAPSSDSEEWTAIAQKNYEKVKEQEIEKIRKTGLHPTGRKLKANEDPEKVWESALAASYEQDGSAPEAEDPLKEEGKKTSAPKKTSTRRKTTRTSTRKTSTKKKSS